MSGMRFNDKRLINNIRSLAIDMIDEASSGHPGIALGAAPIIYTLFSRHLKFYAGYPTWCNRDRFVLSAGHGSAMLYATLFLNGYDYTIDDLKEFRNIGSKTPGHPEYKLSCGVEMTTGPLGQGIATAVGMAIAEKYLKTTFNTKDYKLFDYHIYTLVGDGDLMEGVASEAISLAGTLKLDNLIVLYDSNGISLDGSTDLTFSEDILARFDAAGFDILEVSNGESVSAIDKAISKAKKNKRPTVIEIKTKIGAYSSLEGTNKVHGAPLSKMDIKKLKTALKVDSIPFSYDEKEFSLYLEYINNKGKKSYNAWKNVFDEYYLKDNPKKDVLQSIVNKENITIRLEKLIDFNKIDISNMSLRELNEVVINRIADYIPEFIGGSADVASSTKTMLKNKGIFSKGNYGGRNIYYGVREHLMGAVSNGLALSNLRSFASTFLVFSDYLKPAIRMSALMDLPVTHIFTHDTINIGPDGPTHQPIEQLESLRMIPNYSVYRPCDITELIGCWNNILSKAKPCALVLSRNKTNNLKSTSIEKTKHGAYIVSEAIIRINAIIMASGSEVDLALKVKDILKENGLDIRVVSVPNINIFNNESYEYKEKILPKGVKIFAIEYSNASSYYRYTKDEYIFCMNSFGTSGKSEDVIKHFGLDEEQIARKILKLLNY